jgi:hypothetical protein
MEISENGYDHLKGKCPYCTTTLNGSKYYACKNHKWQNDIKVRYYTFHFHNIGYSFVESKTGNIVRKIILWQEYHKTPRNLVLLQQGRHPDYTKIDSKLWKNGIFVGESLKEAEELKPYYTLFLHEKDENVIRKNGKR